VFHISKRIDDDRVNVGVFFSAQLIADIVISRKSQTVLDIMVYDGFGDEMSSWADFIEDPE
jgi:hypothetical protein